MDFPQKVDCNPEGSLGCKFFSCGIKVGGLYYKYSNDLKRLSFFLTEAFNREAIVQ
jgi:hypothetical protein